MDQGYFKDIHFIHYYLVISKWGHSAAGNEINGSPPIDTELLH